MYDVFASATKDLRIEPRFLIAYGLIALLVVGAIAGFFYIRHHSHREVYRRQRKLQKERSNKRKDS